MESDAVYFRRRSLEERLAALRAGNFLARQRHLEMAERYDDLVRGLTAPQQQRQSRENA